jgi:adenylate cyclase
MRSRLTQLALWGWRLLHRQTILILGLLFALGAIAAVWNMSRLSTRLVKTQAFENAQIYAASLEEARTLYSSEAVARAEEVTGISVSHDYFLTPGGIPLPATFLIDLGTRIREKKIGASVRLYSDYPFPWRAEEGGARDNFEKEALAYLRRYPEERFSRIDNLPQGQVFRYAQADIMRPSCIGCHNTHPQSPKTDWMVGDVRGILEVVQPLDTISAQVHRGLRETLIMLLTISALAIAGITIVITRLRRISQELEERVDERTAELQTSNQNLALEREKAERLLLNILPEAIAMRLKESPSSIAQSFDSVTILFADIVGFTPLSAQIAPIQLVNLLNQIFSEFDRLAEQYNLEKIKTIGDAYMVVGGLPSARHDHAEAIANMALEMQAAIARFQAEWGESFQIRIGINTGSVVAGVIGKKKFIYDLWGDAVNVASRMESSGEPNKIQVTAATYERIKDRFWLQERGEIAVKGKGKMMTYWLVDRKSFSHS